MIVGPLPIVPSSAGPLAAGAVARVALDAGAPRHPEVHLVDAGGPNVLWVVNGSRLYEVADEVFRAVDAALEDGAVDAVDRHLAALGVTAPAFVDDTPPARPPTRALSLAVAQKCNLGCTYCYAQQGSFGGAPKDMPLETARRAADLLIDGAGPEDRVNLAFLGGEPWRTARSCARPRRTRPRAPPRAG